MVMEKLYTHFVRDEARAEFYEKGKTKGYAKGYVRGFRAGERKTQARWREWNARRKQAERAGLPFTEPEP